MTGASKTATHQNAGTGSQTQVSPPPPPGQDPENFNPNLPTRYNTAQSMMAVAAFAKSCEAFTYAILNIIRGLTGWGMGISLFHCGFLIFQMVICAYSTVIDIDVKGHKKKFLPLATTLMLFTSIDLFFSGVTGSMIREGIFYAPRT